ncbi:MAG: BadF/BadG/BcrA/BcrD ATPase family protein [Clostridia bacterium]
MANYLAVDSGGTKTVAIIFNEKGKILGTGKSVGGNAVLMEKNAAMSSVLFSSLEAIKNSGLTNKDIKRGFLFIPGFKEVFDDYKKAIEIDVELKSEMDELKFSELQGRDGIVVLAGTGSFAAAIIGGECQSKIGGWGTILGDEGSGYDIGLSAIKHAIQDFDDGRETSFTKLVKEHFQIESVETLRKIIYSDKQARAKIADVCKKVCDLAKLGDVDCNAILKNACDELAKMANRVYIKSESNEILPVHLAGGLKNAGKIVEDKFKNSVDTICGGKLYFEKSDVEPIYGGALALLYSDGIDITNLKIK